MTGDLAAVLLGVAAAALYLAYIGLRNRARREQKAELNRRFGAGSGEKQP